MISWYLSSYYNIARICLNIVSSLSLTDLILGHFPFKEATENQKMIIHIFRDCFQKFLSSGFKAVNVMNVSKVLYVVVWNQIKFLMYFLQHGDI